MGVRQLGGKHLFLLGSDLTSIAPKFGLAEVSLGNLLRQAADKNLIERKYKIVNGHRVVAYRRAAIKPVDWIAAAADVEETTE